jgi:hypothetical protein
MSQRNAMVQTMLTPFVMAARECAVQMLSNAEYVLAELPKVAMPEELRVRTRESCERLVGTKHDLITALFDLTEPKMAAVSEAEIGERVGRIERWAFEDLVPLVRVVQELDAASRRDPELTLASVLVMESAGNMLQAFDAMHRAAEGVQRAVRGESIPGVAVE